MILGIETSTPLGGVALLGPDGLVAAHSADVRGTHASRLMEAVEQVLAVAGLALPDLAGIGISAGPGSFTGLRVGVATAQGLARGANVPLYPVPTLEAVAWGVPGAAAVGTVMTARRSEVYLAAYRHRDGELETLLTPCAVPPERAAELLGALHIPLRLAGTGAEPVGEMLRRAGHGITVAPPLFARPRAAVICWRAQWMRERGLSAAPSEITPAYLAVSQAEAAAAARAREA